jgi:periplasmic divalent cation tolerance protein
MYCVVLVTCPQRDAEKIAKTLIGKKLAACVNEIPLVKSVYRWKGKMQTARESLLLIKTRTVLFGKLEAEIRKMHPYEVPEIIALPITEGFRHYLDWIRKETE